MGTIADWEGASQGASWPEKFSAAATSRQGIGAIALVGGVSAIVYLSVFIAQFRLGWWRGMGDLFEYYKNSMVYNRSSLFPAKPASPWWSWPLMLHADFYRKPFRAGKIAAVWSGGNPAVWWGALAAIVIAAIRAARGRGLEWAFLAVGYTVYMAMWIPVGRSLYAYSYMAPLYLGIVALGAILAECWRGNASRLEHALVMVAIAPVVLFGLGGAVGAIAVAACIGGYVGASTRFRAGGKFVCALYVLVASVTFLYFLPLWIAEPVSPSAIAARMWLHGKGSLLNWN
jgi:dolichyl-phosphate-mannose--protein O-mannosyl transferase